MIRKGTRVVFTTTDTTQAQHDGKTATVARIIRRPDAEHDAEVLPMYVLQAEGGTSWEAWRDELTRAD